jgi:hypothetical protein
MDMKANRNVFPTYHSLRQDPQINTFPDLSFSSSFFPQQVGGENISHF